MPPLFSNPTRYLGLARVIVCEVGIQCQQQSYAPNVYNKRGKFYSSSFEEAEFYGRPGEPERVTVKRPLSGDEAYIERTLLGEVPSTGLKSLQCGEAVIAARFALDKRLKEAAVAQGYDCIALMTPKAWKQFLDEGKLPRSIELNVLSCDAG